MTRSAESVVQMVHESIREMAIMFKLPPGERINELELSRELGVSRTPLREALGRLHAEGFLNFQPGKGYFGRPLDPTEIFQLYELRRVIETAGVRLAVERASDKDIDALDAFLVETGPDAGDRTKRELVALDETFHERLMKMSDNQEMLSVLRNVNARIQFVRWFDLDRASRVTTQKEHRAVLKKLKARRADDCVAILEKHITRRIEQITACIKEGLTEIYVNRSINLR